MSKERESHTIDHSIDRRTEINMQRARRRGDSSGSLDNLVSYSHSPTSASHMNSFNFKRSEGPETPRDKRGSALVDSRSHDSGDSSRRPSVKVDNHDGSTRRASVRGVEQLELHMKSSDSSDFGSKKPSPKSDSSEASSSRRSSIKAVDSGELYSKSTDSGEHYHSKKTVTVQHQHLDSHGMVSSTTPAKKTTKSTDTPTDGSSRRSSIKASQSGELSSKSFDYGDSTPHRKVAPKSDGHDSSGRRSSMKPVDNYDLNCKSNDSGDTPVS